MGHLAWHGVRGGAAVPLVIPLGTRDALDADLVGDSAALLSKALRLGLPVAHGYVVPITGSEPRILQAIWQAWMRTKGPVRVSLSVTSASGADCSHIIV